jgi:hypothetical protein
VYTQVGIGCQARTGKIARIEKKEPRDKSPGAPNKVLDYPKMPDFTRKKNLL